MRGGDVQGSLPACRPRTWDGGLPDRRGGVGYSAARGGSGPSALIHLANAIPPSIRQHRNFFGARRRPPTLLSPTKDRRGGSSLWREVASSTCNFIFAWNGDYVHRVKPLICAARVRRSALLSDLGGWRYTRKATQQASRGLTATMVMGTDMGPRARIQASVILCINWWMGVSVVGILAQLKRWQEEASRSDLTGFHVKTAYLPRCAFTSSSCLP
jgi:hypothetical protein